MPVLRRELMGSCSQRWEQKGFLCVSVADGALFGPHQTNLRIIQAVAQRLGLPLERVALTIHDYGTMFSATVPSTLDEAPREERIRPGDLILLATFGSGLAWGTALIHC